MKKLIIFAGLILWGITSNAQIMQASIGLGPEENLFKIFLKSSATLPNLQMSTVQYSIGIPASTTPVPTLEFVDQPVQGGYQVTPPYIEDGYLLYDLVTAVSTTYSFTANLETLAISFKFNGGPATPTNVSLVTLPGGGAITGNALFLFTGGVFSVENQLYYTRTGTTVINNPSYTGSSNSTASLGAVVLPIKLGDFTVTKQNNDGYLTWVLLDQDASANHFDIERSINGTDFVKISTVQASAATGVDVVYNFTDPNLPALQKSIIYYRIKAVDKNGNVLYTDIKNLRLSSVKNQASVFPNPAKEFTNVSFTAGSTGKGQITLLDASGKRISEQTFTTIQGTNKQLINTANLAAGTYNIILSTPEETINLTFVKLK